VSLVKLVINAVESDVDPHTTVAALVERLAGPAPRGVAVAVNDGVVPRSAWAGTCLADGDRVEVLTATQGG
jgi:sulfur carrier protein